MDGSRAVGSVCKQRYWCGYKWCPGLPIASSSILQLTESSEDEDWCKESRVAVRCGQGPAYTTGRQGARHDRRWTNATTGTYNTVDSNHTVYDRIRVLSLKLVMTVADWKSLRTLAIVIWRHAARVSRIVNCLCSQKNPPSESSTNLKHMETNVQY